MLGCLLVTAVLAADDVVVEVETGPSSRGRVTGLVDAPIGPVLDVVMDCEGSARWFPGVFETRLVEPGDRGHRCAGVTDLPWPFADRTWEIQVTRWSGADGVVFVAFAYLPGSGDLEALEGYYRLEPQGGQTRVSYEAAVDLGGWIPEVQMNWATERMLPGILEGLEERAQSYHTAGLAYQPAHFGAAVMAK
jgi:hypothetical protein